MACAESPEGVIAIDRIRIADSDIRSRIHSDRIIVPVRFQAVDFYKATPRIDLDPGLQMIQGQIFKPQIIIPVRVEAALAGSEERAVEDYIPHAFDGNPPVFGTRR